MSKLNLIKYPTIDEITSALFIQPHPDDNEIGAGGTIAYLRDKNIPVYVLTVTKGDGGSQVYSPDELAIIREAETVVAAQLLNDQYVGNLGYSNRNQGTIETICADIVAIIRQYRPQAIFSVDPDLANECHPVHNRVGQAVKEAFIRAGQTYYPFENEKKQEDAFAPNILGQYFTDKDNTIVDITPFYEQKITAIKAHQSQISSEFLAALDAYNDLIATGTSYAKVERLKLLSTVHTHCFALPKIIKDQL